MTKIILLPLILIFLCSVCFAVDYKLIDEYHSLMNHFIILDIVNTDINPKDIRPEFDLVSDLGFDVSNTKIEVMTTKLIADPIYKPIEQCEMVEANKSFVEQCQVTGFDFVRTDYHEKEVFVEASIKIESIAFGQRITAKEFLSIPKTTTKRIKISWQTPILNLIDGFGSYGSWSFNPVGWWNETWDYRLMVNTTNPPSNPILRKGHTHNITIDTAALITAGKMQPDCDDAIPVYNGSGTNVELNRVIENCNTTTTIIYFAAQKNQTNGTTSTNEYWLYYGNLVVSAPTINKSKVSMFECDYSSDVCGMPEVDDNGISITYDSVLERLNFTMIRNADAYLYKNLGASVTGADINGFQVDYKIQISARDAGDNNFYTGFGDTLQTLDDYWSSEVGNWIYISGDANGWMLGKTDSPNDFTQDTSGPLNNVDQFLTMIHRSGASTQDAYWYNDSARTILEDSLTGVAASTTDFTYFFLINNYNTADTKYIEGWIDDVKFTRLLPSPPTYVFGAEETSYVNTAPNITTPTVIPTQPTVLSFLNCSATPTDTRDVNLTVYFIWYDDNMTLMDAYNSTIATTNNTLVYTDTLVPMVNSSTAQTWTCSVRAYDNNLYSAWINTTVTVGSLYPVLTCEYDERPYIKFMNMINWICLINDSFVANPSPHAINCEYDAMPYIKFLNRINWICSINAT